jgi:MFS family permease
MHAPPSEPGVVDRSAIDSFLIVAAIGIFQTGLGVLAALIPVSLAHGGLPVSLSGLVISAGSAGFLAGCIVAPTIVRVVGVRPALYAAVAISAAMSVSLWLWGVGGGWILIRGISGFASGIVFPITEAWLADRSPAGRRAAYFSLYQITSRSVYAAAQLSLTWVDPASVALFLAAAIAALFAPMPCLAVSRPAPSPGQRVFGAMFDVPRRAPAAAAASFSHGMVTGASTSLLPIWAVAQGLSVERIAVMLVALQLAAILLQVPVGLLADKLERRVVMAALALLVAVLSAAAPSLLFLPVELQPILFGLWGASAYPLYSVAVAHMNDIARPDERVAWGGSLLVIWGIGATVGPLLVATAMQGLGAGALFACTAGAGLALFAFLVWRLSVQRRQRKPGRPDIAMQGPP